MKYYWGPGKIQDGNLSNNEGRIVIYKDYILVGFNSNMDHNYLLRGLASKYSLHKEEVISNAIRLYFRFENDLDRCIVCGRRKIDDEEFEKNYKRNAFLVKNALR